MPAKIIATNVTNGVANHVAIHQSLQNHDEIHNWPLRTQMIKSFASRIWVRVLFIAFCVVSQEFHSPM